MRMGNVCTHRNDKYKVLEKRDVCKDRRPTDPDDNIIDEEMRPCSRVEFTRVYE